MVGNDDFLKAALDCRFGVFATGATAEAIVCKGCDPKEHEGSVREQIKAIVPGTTRKRKRSPPGLGM